MADGSRKPIEDVEVGDKVLATDPETGETVAREVTHLWVHGDTLIDLIVDGDVITTTEDHPFWNETDGEWQRADHLDEGDLVRGADGDLLEVHGLDWSSARTGTAYNLTVDDIHTYYVGAGDESVLVHNACGLLPGEGNVGTYDDLIKAGSPGDNLTPHHVPSANRMAGHGVDPGDAIAINMEHPFPGAGGRHRATFSYGTQADAAMAPRNALAAGVRDMRRIYQYAGLYGPDIRASLQELIAQNKATFPGLFSR